MANYPERECLYCGKKFTPHHAYVVCCSEECKKERRKQIAAEARKKYREKNKENALATIFIKDEVERGKRRIEELENALEEAQKRIEDLSSERALLIACFEKGITSACGAIQTTVVSAIERLSNNSDVYKSAILESLRAKAQYCDRLSLTATHLPCGMRGECFKPRRCDRCPGDATPENAIKGYSHWNRGSFDNVFANSL